MKRVRNISDLPNINHPIVLAMGCFDGIHIGHQKVISTAVEQAAERGGQAWVYTFNPHPAKRLVPDKAPPLISAEPCRLRQLKALGVAGVIETPFTREFAALTPKRFLSTLCADAPTLSGIVCGEDWSFGSRAAGNFQTLKTFGKKHAFTATAVSPVMDGKEKVSSTRIRNAVTDGNIPLAEKLLGRPFSLFGTVIPGNHIGRDLGYPTANIDPLNELLPGPGVYAAYTLLQTSGDRDQESGIRGQEPDCLSVAENSKLHASAVFIGKRETFGCHKHVIESHLFDFDGDLYGQEIEVVLVRKTREVGPFPSKEALVEQIGKDVAQIRKNIAQNNQPFGNQPIS